MSDIALRRVVACLAVCPSRHRRRPTPAGVGDRAGRAARDRDRVGRRLGDAGGAVNERTLEPGAPWAEFGEYRDTWSVSPTGGWRRSGISAPGRSGRIGSGSWTSGRCAPSRTTKSGSRPTRPAGSRGTGSSRSRVGAGPRAPRGRRRRGARGAGRRAGPRAERARARAQRRRGPRRLPAGRSWPAGAWSRSTAATRRCARAAAAPDCASTTGPGRCSTSSCAAEWSATSRSRARAQRVVDLRRGRVVARFPGRRRDVQLLLPR